MHIESSFDEETGCARYMITGTSESEVSAGVEHIRRYWEEQGNYQIEVVQPRRPIGSVYEAFIRVRANPTTDDIQKLGVK